MPWQQSSPPRNRTGHGYWSIDLDIRLELIPDCGHPPHVELPERFAAVLGGWLAEHGGLAA